MVVDRVPVPSSADEDALDALLYRLKAMPTRVFVVHATHDLAARLFRRASKAGMMSDGYAWVAKDGVASFLDSFDPEDLDFMQGVVSLRPHVKYTKQVKNFSARFRARFRKENPSSDDDVLNDATVLRLWSYDTARAIAAAAEAASVPGPAFRTPQNSTARTDLDRLGVSATGEALLRAVLNTTFDGMAGRFKLVDGQLQVAAYEVVNIIGNGAMTVGFWTPESGISRDLKVGSSKGEAGEQPVEAGGDHMGVRGADPDLELHGEPDVDADGAAAPGPTVTDVKELQRRGQHIGYQEGSFIEPLLTKMGFDGRKMKKYSTLDQYAEALSNGSVNGGVDAVFDEIPYLKMFLSQQSSQHRDGYMQVGPIYKTDGFGFVFPRGSPMTGDVSRQILKLAEGDKMAQIEKAWFGEPGACQDALAGCGGGSSNLSFWSFGGLFLITGVVSSLMLLLYLAIFAYREREELREAEAKAEAEAGSGSVSVRRLRAWLQHFDRKDLKSPTFKTWNDGSVRNGSEFTGRTPRWNGGAGDASMTPRAGGEEHANAMEGTSPLSVYISSEMNAGSSPEGTPASEISESFEQRIEGAAAAVEMTMPTASQ
ncbi:Glutamate receptor 2.8 [Triticum urartu]|uniref:Glutamate receptor 2.8 n=1 Tax=Triticum urartu TaxID=4572 RepID=M7Y825_TRIUA|nr:Glutamate receptor 2.8 [Triticum urartu]